MNFLKTSYLPTKKVKYMIIDNRVEESIKTELRRMNITLFEVKECPYIQKGVSSHPDMHVFHKGNGDFFVSDFIYQDFDKFIRGIENIDCENFNNRRVAEKLEREYPFDVPLNVASVGEYIILNEKTASKEILAHNDKKVIRVKQGYTKCSVAQINENAIITDDISIYNSAKNFIDVLFIEHDTIKLNGYSYGFIGGCSGKISDNEIIFSGNLLKHKNGKDIISFCKNHSVDAISLGLDDLYDYGSFIPIIE